VSDIEGRLDTIYQTTDTMLRAGRFEDVDAMLRAVDPTALPIIEALSYLTITSLARDKLLARADLYTRTRKHFARVDPARVDDLLRGLE